MKWPAEPRGGWPSGIQFVGLTRLLLRRRQREPPEGTKTLCFRPPAPSLGVHKARAVQQTFFHSTIVNNNWGAKQNTWAGCKESALAAPAAESKALQCPCRGAALPPQETLLSCRWLARYLRH